MARQPQVRISLTSTSRDSTSPQFLKRLFELAFIRVNESKWTRLFTFVVFVQAILTIILESLILNSYVIQNAAIFETDNATFQNEDWNKTHSYPGATQAVAAPGGFHNVTGADPYEFPEDRLTRLQYENIFFMCFQLWLLYFGIDSIVRQNLIQVIAHFIINFFCIIFAGVQITETIKWKNIVNNIDNQYQIDHPTDLTHFYEAIHFEISLTASLFVFTMFFGLFAFKLYKQFGWNIYKRIGGDVAMQNIFRIYQIFVIFIKVDAFFQLVLAVFWLVVMIETAYLTQGDILQRVWFGVHAAVTILNIPALFLARIAIKNENPVLVVIFLIFEIIVAADFCIIIQQSSSQWGFWVFAVCVAIIFTIVTSMYVIICTGNFNKGLKPHIQRMFGSNYRSFADPTNNPSAKMGNWEIDDLSRGPSLRRPEQDIADIDMENIPGASDDVVGVVNRINRPGDNENI